MQDVSDDVDGSLEDASHLIEKHLGRKKGSWGLLVTLEVHLVWQFVDDLS